MNKVQARRNYSKYELSYDPHKQGITRKEKGERGIQGVKGVVTCIIYIASDIQGVIVLHCLIEIMGSWVNGCMDGVQSLRCERVHGGETRGLE